MERRALEDTVVAAQAGDPGALGRLVDEFARTVLGAAYGFCGDGDVAHDIAQEAFAIAIERLGELREPAAFPGWILTLVRTAAARARRRRPLEALPAAPMAAAGTGPEDVASARDDARRLRLAVEDLPAELRLPTVLHYFAELPVAEISSLCGVPVSTVKKRMRDARKRLRDGGDVMAEERLQQIEPPGSGRLTDVIRLYAALRAGDAGRVEALLRARPELVDARENWTTEESFAHRLPLVGAGGGTPLLRVIERGDASLSRLLLEHGADPNGGCECPGGEQPLWTAVVHRRVEIVGELLAAGADPNACAFRGTTPLHVAAMRGYDELIDLLRAHGADPEAQDANGRTPREWAVDAQPSLALRLRAVSAPALETGIKAIDLWCPLPRRGLVRWTAGVRLGSSVLLAELSWRIAQAGHPVVWTGFTQAPTDLGDVHHGLAELGVAERVSLHVASHEASPDERRLVLERGLRAMRESAAASPEGALLVIFEEIGCVFEIELRMAELAALPCTTIVVAPIHPVHLPPRPGAGAWLASVAFDGERARRRRWPAVGAEGSWSRLLDPEGAALAARGRALLRAGGAQADALDAYLAQPFLTAQPFSGLSGESVSVSDLRSRVRELVSVQPS